VHDVVLGVAKAVLNLLVGDGDAEAAHCGLIHPHHGRLDGSLSGFMDRKLYRVVSCFSPLTVVVM